MTHARRALSLTTGSAAVLALVATPASAHLQAGSSPATVVAGTTAAPDRVMHRFGDDSLTPAELQALVQAKLDAIAARTSADRAQWSEVASSTVLTSAQRRAAWTDLFAARRALAVLAAVEARDVATAAQQEAVDELQADLRTLVTKLRALLANKPVVVPTATTAVSSGEGGAKTEPRHRCDGDGGWGDAGFGFGDRDRDWDGDRRWDGDRSWDGRR